MIYCDILYLCFISSVFFYICILSVGQCGEMTNFHDRGENCMKFSKVCQLYKVALLGTQCTKPYMFFPYVSSTNILKENVFENEENKWKSKISIWWKKLLWKSNFFYTVANYMFSVVSNILRLIKKRKMKFGTYWRFLKCL